MSTPLAKAKLPQKNLIVPFGWKRAFLFLGLLYVSTLVYTFLPVSALVTEAMRRMISIFVFVALLWMTEVIPPFATSILLVCLEIVFLGSEPGLVSKAHDPEFWKVFLAPAGSSLALLFFGAFVMAKAFHKYRLDYHLAGFVLRPLSHSPYRLLMGVMGLTAVFSMFLSNTAVAALVITMMLPVLAQLPSTAQGYKRALVLGIAFAANIGGMASMIGTPPNLIAVGVLASLKPPVRITFLEWALFGVPLAIVLLLFTYGALCTVFKFRHKFEMKISFDEIKVAKGTWIIYAVFALTVLLWCTEHIHGFPAAVVTLLPLTVLTVYGLIDRHDINSLEWNVIILILGGLSLAAGFKVSGVVGLLQQTFSFQAMGLVGSVIISLLLIMVISNFMSNSAAASFIIPFIAGVGGVFAPQLSVAVALGASLAMSLPISTPPNAIAFNTDMLRAREMALIGTAISLFGLVCITAYFWLTH